MSAPRNAAPTAIPTAIGITVYNEERNLDALLREAVRATGPHLDARQIVVVSSGSTDRTIEIARAWAARDPRIEVAIDPVRRGKATAVNQFLARVRPEVRVCVLSGGDMLPRQGCIDALVAPFADPDVGMAGAHPVPTNSRESWVDRVVHLQWALHHELALRRPKMGELVAFRADVPSLDPETVVDEAWLETVAIARGQRLVYVPEAVVLNRGPSIPRELIDQRRRVFCGHLWLRGTRRYEVATFPARTLLGVALRHVIAEPGDAGALLAAGAAELVGRALGTADYLRGEKPFVWSTIASSKDAISREAGAREDGAREDGVREHVTRDDEHDGEHDDDREDDGLGTGALEAVTPPDEAGDRGPRPSEPR